MMPQFCPENYHGNWMLAAADEWRKMLDAWAWFCFEMPGFFIVHTPDKGFGIYKPVFKYVCIDVMYCLSLFFGYSSCQDCYD
jgi:hypothetical protein